MLDYIEDNKETIAMNGEHRLITLIKKEDFIKSVLRHGRLTDARTIESKWKHLLLLDFIVKNRYTGQTALNFGAINCFKETDHDFSLRLNRIISEGFDLIEERERISKEKKSCVRESERDTSGGVTL